jgi:hypothetical protein
MPRNIWEPFNASSKQHNFIGEACSPYLFGEQKEDGCADVLLFDGVPVEL